MNETTEGRSVSVALRMIAGWKEVGPIQGCVKGGDIWYDHDGETFCLGICKYRAKPRKPKRYQIYDHGAVVYYEGTPEVIAVLEREGLL